ncbi:nck-associated protein 5-like, partial [Heterodontus francisci]|uniref:nck-associated protein 5-like n=1 Tax=Heterodontus francisci TaxID=7792 RepID=UPI00355C2A38
LGCGGSLTPSPASCPQDAPCLSTEAPPALFSDGSHILEVLRKLKEANSLGRLAGPRSRLPDPNPWLRPRAKPCDPPPDSSPRPRPPSPLPSRFPAARERSPSAPGLLLKLSPQPARAWSLLPGRSEQPSEPDTRPRPRPRPSLRPRERERGGRSPRSLRKELGLSASPLRVPREVTGKQAAAGPGASVSSTGRSRGPPSNRLAPQTQALQAEPQALQAEPQTQALQAVPQTQALQAEPQALQAEPQTQVLQAMPQALQAVPQTQALQAVPQTQALQAEPQAPAQAQPQPQAQALRKLPSRARSPVPQSKQLSRGDGSPKGGPRPKALAAESRLPGLGPLPPAPSTIEEKVMRGIEENMQRLRLQAGEAKQPRAGGGPSSLATWFGFHRSKLPAMVGRKEQAGAEEEEEEGEARTPGQALGRRKVHRDREPRKSLPQDRWKRPDSGKLGPRGEEEEEEEEGTPVGRRGEGTDNFMQQLLNRVDGKESLPTSGPSKTKPSHRTTELQSSGHTADAQTDGLVSRPQLIAEPPDTSRLQVNHLRSSEDIHHLEKIEDSAAKYDITSDESLTEVLASHCFIGSNFQTRTLDSGIGTFPPPDAAGSVLRKLFPHTRMGQQEPGTPGRGRTGGTVNIPRKARTLERELPCPGDTQRCDDMKPTLDIPRFSRETVQQLKAAGKAEVS